MSNDRLYVSFDNRIDVYDANAQGTAAPLRSISGPNTHLKGVLSLGLDSQENLYAAMYDGVAVFDPGAHGNATPIRVLAAGGTSLALDGQDNLYLLQYEGALPWSQVAVFPPGASGNTAPIRAVTGIQVGQGNILSVAVDMFDQLYVCGDIPGWLNIYAANASGNAAPVANFGGLLVPVAMDFDGINNLYVSDVSQGTLVFAQGQSPSWKIGMSGALAVDQFGVVYSAVNLVDKILGEINIGIVYVYTLGQGGGGYSLTRTITLAVNQTVNAMVVNKPRPRRRGSPWDPGPLYEIVGRLLNKGPAVDGGGVIFVNNVPIPVGPWGEVRGAMTVRGDILMGLAVEQFALSVQNVEGRSAIRRAALEMVRSKVGELLAQLE